MTMRNTPTETEAPDSLDICDSREDNPLIWPILGLLRGTSQSWKLHHLASALGDMGLMQDLDDLPEKALFKCNFLIMNALFALQDALLPEQWLRVRAMDIRLCAILPNNLALSLEEDEALRGYYLNWANYDTSPEVIREMLAAFWRGYDRHIGIAPDAMDRQDALRVFELESGASGKEIRRQWRRLALKWHPDRIQGDSIKFHRVCEAWQILRGKV